MTTTLKRLDEDSYAVMIGLKRVGTVTKGWSRTGGQGWIYTNEKTGNLEISTMLTRPTRKLAVSTLLNRIRHGMTNAEAYRRRCTPRRGTPFHPRRPLNSTRKTNS